MQQTASPFFYCILMTKHESVAWSFEPELKPAGFVSCKMSEVLLVRLAIMSTVGPHLCKFWGIWKCSEVAVDYVLI